MPPAFRYSSLPLAVPISFALAKDFKAGSQSSRRKVAALESQFVYQSCRLIFFCAD